MSDLFFKRFVLRVDSDDRAGIIFDTAKDPIQVVAVSSIVSALEDACDAMNAQETK